MDIGALFERLVEVAQQDEEFRRRSAYVDACVRFGVDDEGHVLRFRGGRLLDVVPDTTIGLDPDYEIVGPREDWERMWKREVDLTEAVIPIFGSIQIRGDRVLYASQTEAIVHLTRLLADAAEGLGADVAPPPPPNPVAGPDVWETEHEVLGRYATVEGVRTYYEMIGEPDRPLAFIALHTAGRDCRQWQRMGDVLARVGTFHSFDLPGHGKSWPVSGEDLGCLQSVEAWSRFTWALRDAIGITAPTVFLGCSIGGNLALQMAHDHDVVASISMQGAAHTPTQPDEALAMMNHPEVNPAFHHVDRTISLTGVRTPVEVRDYLRWETRNYSSRTIQSDLRAYSGWDLRDHLADITCPVLLIRGVADWIVSAEMVEDTARGLVNAPVEIDMPEGIGHFPHVEQPVEMGERVLAFLERQGVIGA